MIDPLDEAAARILTLLDGSSGDPLALLAALYAGETLNETDIIAACRSIAAAALAGTGWRPIAEFDPSQHVEDNPRLLIAGEHSNGVRWVDCSYWSPYGHFRGHRLEEPRWWQPMPAPPPRESTDE